MRAETQVCSLLWPSLLNSGLDNCEISACMPSIDGSHALSSVSCQAPIRLGQTFLSTIPLKEVAFVNPITTLAAWSILQVSHVCNEYNIQPEKTICPMLRKLWLLWFNLRFPLPRFSLKSHCFSGFLSILTASSLRGSLPYPNILTITYFLPFYQFTLL